VLVVSMSGKGNGYDNAVAEGSSRGDSRAMGRLGAVRRVRCCEGPLLVAPLRPRERN
jgi:hypothetical protein